jgi:hypothetical protein
MSTDGVPAMRLLGVERPVFQKHPFFWYSIPNSRALLFEGSIAPADRRSREESGRESIK